MSAATIRYRGTSSRGVAVCGALGRFTVAEAVALAYRSGYRTLRVTDGHRVIGEITRHPETGRRTWWAQS